MQIWGLLLFTGLSLGTAAQAATPAVTPAAPSRLMLVPFENHLKDQDTAIGTASLDSFQNALLQPNNRFFKLIDRRQIQAVIAELAFSESALSDPRNALKLGKQLSANLMLSGSVSAGKIHTSAVTTRQPTEYTWATVQVNATLTQVETGEVLFSQTVQGQSERYPSWQGSTYTSIILDAVRQASDRLAQDLVHSQHAIRQAGAL